MLDDNELDNFVNKNTIEANHFAEKVYFNTSGKNGLEFLNNLSIAGGDHCVLCPELIFVDLNMPLMDGFQFIKNLIRNSKGKRDLPKLVILTSSIREEDKISAQKILPDIIFMHKPLTPALLATL